MPNAMPCEESEGEVSDEEKIKKAEELSQEIKDAREELAKADKMFCRCSSYHIQVDGCSCEKFKARHMANQRIEKAQDELEMLFEK